ncbi:uncharacterized protein BX663DRAFT_519556, partial [Cokeromyces recurvatus]|uniref:uncharacterized protein n=1 Tax=Cokeromyces recurvatus TaxID=90255 RepID=UPI00221F97B6
MMQQRVHHQQEIKYYRGLESGLSDRITFHQENGIDKEEGLSLQFFVDNQTLHVELSFDWYGTLGRCVLRYGAILAQFLWISTSIILLTQLYSYVMNGKQDFIAFPEALVNCVSGSFLRFVILLFIVSIIHYYYSLSSNYSVLKDILLGSDDWLLTGLLILAFGLSIGLTAFLWLVTSSLVFLLSLLPLCLFRCPSPNITHLSTKYYYFLCHLSIVIGLLAFLPSALVFIGYLLVWLFFTCSARISCTLQPDMPSLQNLYKYRQSCLIFFISILPYYVPSVIVCCKDLLIGWTHYYRLSIITIIQDAPVLLALIYLVTIGSSPESLELRYLLPIIYIMNGIIIYQALFGFLHPFIISHF